MARVRVAPGGPWAIVALAAAPLVGPNGPLAALQVQRLQVQVRVTDVARATAWYSRAFGFDVVETNRPGQGGEATRLVRDDALLTLERGGAEVEGRSAILKIGLLVADLDSLEARLGRHAPESVLVGVSALPPAQHEGWPTRYLLARDPDGTLVQAFDRAGGPERARWLLVAVSVPGLAPAERWYTEEAGFLAVDRPEGGDPRVLLRRGTFYLEVGEFGVVRDPAGVGPWRLRLGATRPDSSCRWLYPPEAWELGLCRSDRPGLAPALAPPHIVPLPSAREGPMKIQEILRHKGHEVVTIEEDHTVLDAVRRLVEHNIGGLVVMSGEHPTGIITERDILRLTARSPDELASTSVSAVMTRELVTAGPEDELHEMMGVMTDRKIRHLPVTREDRLAGIVSIGDLLNACFRIAEQENTQLRQYIHGGG